MVVTFCATYTVTGYRCFDINCNYYTVNMKQIAQFSNFRLWKRGFHEWLAEETLELSLQI